MLGCCVSVRLANDEDESDLLRPNDGLLVASVERELAVEFLVLDRERDLDRVVS